MGRGHFISKKKQNGPTEKVKVVEDVLTGKASGRESARKLGVYKASLKDWIAIYKASGPSGLLDQKRIKKYSEETMLAAVNDYLSGNGSL